MKSEINYRIWKLHLKILQMVRAGVETRGH
jgi:hypothetical protein